MRKAFWNIFSASTGTSCILKIITKVKVIKIIAYLKVNLSLKHGLAIKLNNYWKKDLTSLLFRNEDSIKYSLFAEVYGEFCSVSSS